MMGSNTKPLSEHGMSAHGIVDYQHGKVKRLGDELIQMNRYVSNPFDSMLDHLLHVLHIQPLVKVNEEMLTFSLKVLQTWSDAMGEADPSVMSWYDIMGYMYEYCASNMGKKAMGQFFTPPHICDFMSSITIGDIPANYRHGSKITTISDPTCGSGRTLLSAANYIYNNLPADGYKYMDRYCFYGNDLDYKCTKMTIINFFLHGLTGEITCANGLWMDNDYRFGYHVTCIPMWKYYMGMADKLIQEIKDDVSYLEIDQFLSMFEGNKDAAIKHLYLDREVAKLGKHYSGAMHPEVKKKIAYYILYSDIDGTTYHSVPGSDSIHIIRKIDKESSYQVAVERSIYADNIKAKEQKRLEEKGHGLFADVNINADVIKVKKSVPKTTESVPEQKKSVPKKKKLTTNKPPSGQQKLLF